MATKPKVSVEIGAPQIDPQVEIGMPEIEQPQYGVEVGMPQIAAAKPAPGITVPGMTFALPSNPAHHEPFKQQAANLVAYGRSVGWHPEEIDAALSAMRGKFEGQP